jgi:dephospho-CoA kinase
VVQKKKKNERWIVGIVGKTGSGKSKASKILSEKYGFVHIDVDRFGHLAMVSKRKEVARAFGKSILNQDGSINRKALGNIVFYDRQKRFQLNKILHPEMKKEILSFLECFSKNHIVIDAALLYEIKLDCLCDLVVRVEASEADNRKRIMKKRGWPKSKAENILNVQNELKFIHKKADFILFNNGTKDKLERQVDIMANILLG